jgi:3-oxoacyl-[acyl-carrier protein] reductase
MNHSLKNKRALVTGGSRSIGAAIVKRLASQGAHVALTYSSSPDRASERREGRSSTRRPIPSHPGRQCRCQGGRCRSRAHGGGTGGIDVVVNNARVFASGPIDDFKLEDFDRTVAVNVRAVFVAIQAAIKHMKEGGRIINIGSTNAERMPFGGGGVYAMSKSALQGLVKRLARDLGPRGITINNVQPGPVDTDMNPAEGEFAEMLKKLMALPRYGTVEEIAGMVANLASPEAGYITGANLMIDGGFSA